MQAIRRLATREAILLAATLALGACAGRVEAVQDPQTGQTVSCSEGTLADQNPWSQRDACLADHVAQGWTVKMPSDE